MSRLLTLRDITEIKFPCIHLVLQVFDIDELIKPRKEAAKKKMLDELRDETLESAISKITAAVQTQQLEATDEEDEGKDSSLRGRKGVSSMRRTGMLLVLARLAV